MATDTARPAPLARAALRRHHPRQEPSAVVLHAGICAGGSASPLGEALSLPRHFPAEHWLHLRTNPIESGFATVKLRTRVTKGAGSKKAALAMVYKLLDAASERWRRYQNGHELVPSPAASSRTASASPTTTPATTRRPTRSSPPERPHAISSTTLTIGPRNVARITPVERSERHWIDALGFW